MSKPSKHTILFIQTGNQTSRTYYDFPTVSQCMAFIIELFEKELVRINSRMTTLSYQVSDIYNYIDSLPEFNMLILEPENGSYSPFGRNVIKEKLLKYLNSISRRN